MNTEIHEAEEAPRRGRWRRGSQDAGGCGRSTRTSSVPRDGGAFLTTHWSLVALAGQPGAVQSAAALDRLCHDYWQPLYAFIRRQGHDHHEAEDLTQAFLLRLLGQNGIAAATPQRGRFRSFLVGALKHFLANFWRERRARKRAGALNAVSLDELVLMEPGPLALADPETPLMVLERRWAKAMLERGLARLRAEFVVAGKGELFESLKPFLLEMHPAPHAEIAFRHGLSVNAVGVAIHRVRQRYGELLLGEIRSTIGRQASSREAVRHLLAAFHN